MLKSNAAQSANTASPRRAWPVLHRLGTLPRETRDTLWLLFVVGWVIAPLATHVPLWTMPLAYAMLAWRGWLAWGERPLPARWLKGAMLIAVVALTLMSHRTIVGRDAGVTLIVMLLVLKTLELRARRDAMVVFFLGFFTLLANFFFSQSLGVAAMMVIGLLGLLTALINANLPVGRPPLLRSMRTAAVMTAMGAPIMLVLFMLFPRMAPLWGMPGNDMAGKSGLSEEMTVGNIASLVMDEGIAMRVRFNTPNGRPPEQQHMYFRGPVLTHFDGTRWTASNWFDPRMNDQGVPASAQLEVLGAPISYEVTLESNNRPWLLLLDAADQRPALPHNMRARMTPALQWLVNRPISSVLRYSAQSHVDFRSGPMERTSALQPLVDLPHGFNPRTVALAQEMRADPQLANRGNMAFVNAAMQRLRTGGYSYTLDPGVNGKHAADEFWFDTKQGFCEHIASAFVILMRALDIPARIVTGYQGGEMNGIDGYWTVRQSDAHAWTEVWIEQRGWVRVDPTGAVMPTRIGQFQRLQPPRGMFGTAMDTVISPTAFARMRSVWEAVNNGWNQWVLNYTQERQLNLLRSLGIESPSWQDLGRLLGAIIALAALAGAGWSFWEKNHQDPWQRMLQLTRKRLQSAGLELPAHLPPRSMASAVQARYGEEARSLYDWLMHVDSARYARHPDHALNGLKKEFARLQWPRNKAKSG